MIADVVVPCLSGVIGVGGAWWWIREHKHTEYVTREEFGLLRAMIRESRESVLRELQILRDSLDRRR